MEKANVYGKFARFGIRTNCHENNIFSMRKELNHLKTILATIEAKMESTEPSQNIIQKTLNDDKGVRSNPRCLCCHKRYSFLRNTGYR